MKTPIEEGKVQWTDVYATFRLIPPMPVCFTIDESVAVGDVIDLPFAKPLSGKHRSSTDILTTRLVVTAKEADRVTLESHNTRGLDPGKNNSMLLQEYVQMEFDLKKQMPVKITQNRLTKMSPIPEFSQTVISKLVIDKSH